MKEMIESFRNGPILLLTASGEDSPGITAEITGILARHQVTLLDIAQAVIQRLLSLSLLFQIDPAHSSEIEIIRDLLSKAAELKLKLEFKRMESSPDNRAHFKLSNHYALTLISENLTAQALHEVTLAVSRWNLNIDVIKKLSEDQFQCVEMIISSSKPIELNLLRKELLALSKNQAVDIALQSEGLYRRSKRLVVLDMDSTLIQGEVINELAREKGVYEEVAEITHQTMLGQLDYDESLRLRCKKLEGLHQSELNKIYERIQITPGAEELIRVLKKLGYKTAVISGGFTFVADRLKERLGIDFAFANTLEIKNERLTGTVIPPIINAQKKADLLEEIAKHEKIELDQVIAVGDGANDLLMLEKAGLGIAFNAKPVVRERADLSFNQKNLRPILYLLGLSSKDVAVAVQE